jgi:signal transduction histidine kinase
MPALAARLSAPVWALVGAVLAAAGVAAEASAGPGGLDLLTGLAWIVAGTAVCARRPAAPAGPLALLVGATWFAGALAAGLVYVHRGPLAHLLLTHPTGRTRSPAISGVIAAAYIDGLVPAVARAEWPTIVLAAATIGGAAIQWARATGVERGGRAVSLAGSLAIFGALALAAVLRLAGADADAAMLRAYELALTATAVALALDVLLGRSARAAATGLVVDLGDDHELQSLRSALARALGDPDLQIAYRTPGDLWVDETGATTELGDGGVRTVVEDDGVPVAAMVHSSSALRDPVLERAVTASVRLAVANARMQADLAARIRDVEASRRRLTEAGDAARRRFGDELRDGPERRLREIGSRLRPMGAADLCAELDGCCADLDRFAQGVHPQALTDAGLRAALDVLGRQAAGRVEVVAPAGRFPPEHEAAAYFVCSEALANVAKYAAGAAARILVQARNGRLEVTVTDDGPGGADPARGTGLRGLADRLDVLGGTLRLTSVPGAGTELHAEVPL